ncbi:unnamed protein product [Rotaria sp. Silwood1]|nr:unnamed protein product [Rotaria sp. Silwood1]
MIDEWNSRVSISNLCTIWKKQRPPNSLSENLLFLLYNCECLSTHQADLDILLSSYLPQIVILTGVGSLIRNLPLLPNYYWLSQKGTNSFGGVAILIHHSLKSAIVYTDENFLLAEIDILSSKILVGAVYVPPNKQLPFEHFSRLNGKEFYLFGDFNAKHSLWSCETNNTSGSALKEWMERNGWEGIFPTVPTSKRSSAIIDFALTHNNSGWKVEVIDEGTSDHFPILFSSPFTAAEDGFFRKTNWNLFKFFLSLVNEYWNACVYNFDEHFFFTLFSSFLSSLWDRTSEYITIRKYRPPWPAYLVSLARSVNKHRRKYRRTRFLCHMNAYLCSKREYDEERANYLQKKRENHLTTINQGQNIWRFVNNTFRPYTTSFRGIRVANGIEKDPRKIVDILGNYYEKHFALPIHNPNNVTHIKSITAYEQISYLPNMPLPFVTLNQVEKQWLKFSAKKSLDSMRNSAFLLKNLPIEYMKVITVLFNKCASKGNVFEASKHAKIICLSKDGMYPTEDKLRPISLLPNLGKWFERCIHEQIQEWCKGKGIYTDEQSGFTPNRRLQSRILSICEDLKLTVAANNRPALLIFVDFLSAFDKMWYPALIANLVELDMPLPLIKWIYQWLQERTMSIHHGDSQSKTVKLYVGAPQGSVLAATLFRIHIHFLPQYFFRFCTHLFADDVAILLKGSLEKKLSQNIIELEKQAKIAMHILLSFSENHLLPVNVKKTKAMLVHSAVSPSQPKIFFQNQQIDFVQNFKYLGVEIRVKLGWGSYIKTRILKIRNVYNALKQLFRQIPIGLIHIRKKLFYAFALPHFIWLFMTWFYFTEIQQNEIEHLYASGLRIVYNLWGWEDYTVFVLTREKSLMDYLYKYWEKMIKHLHTATEALDYQQSWEAYIIATSTNRNYYKSMGFRKNSFFLNRLAARAHHGCIMNNILIPLIQLILSDYQSNAIHRMYS